MRFFNQEVAEVIAHLTMTLVGIKDVDVCVLRLENFQFLHVSARSRLSYETLPIFCFTRLTN